MRVATCPACKREHKVFTINGVGPGTDLCPTCYHAQENERDQQAQEQEQVRTFSIVTFMRERWSKFGIPEKFLDSDLGDFSKLPADRPGYIFGETGLGKTHMAVGYLKRIVYDSLNIEAAAKNEAGIPQIPQLINTVDKLADDLQFISAINLIWSTRREIDKSGEFMDRFCKYPFLVLDDFGSERPTPWAEECLEYLIYNRSAECRDTLITSNHSVSEIGKAFNPRIASRLYDFGEPIQLTGSDRRPAMPRKRRF